MSITICFQVTWSDQIVAKKISKAVVAPPEGKNKRKFRAGAVALKVFCVIKQMLIVALKEIRRYKKSTELLIRKLPFQVFFFFNLMI